MNYHTTFVLPLVLDPNLNIYESQRNSFQNWIANEDALYEIECTWYLVVLEITFLNLMWQHSFKLYVTTCLPIFQSGETALHKACRRCHHPIVKELLAFLKHSQGDCTDFVKLVTALLKSKLTPVFIVYFLHLEQFNSGKQISYRKGSLPLIPGKI